MIKSRSSCAQICNGLLAWSWEGMSLWQEEVVDESKNEEKNKIFRRVIMIQCIDGDQGTPVERTVFNMGKPPSVLLSYDTNDQFP